MNAQQNYGHTIPIVLAVVVVFIPFECDAMRSN